MKGLHLDLLVKDSLVNYNNSFNSKQKYNLTIEIEKVEHVYGKVGDYVIHRYKIDTESYYTTQKANLTLSKDDKIKIISISCDCNEKLVDIDEKLKIVDVSNLKIGVNRFLVELNLYENNGKYAGHSAKYIFHYKVTLS
ncbi:hypothetical protein [Winogradskyella tangerina]|uniref:hypothetical protein n=1 Tax=Winogradskyella tangerina TaxID=2023240 RepID=UPI0013007A6C|nr:hypothetical protein [Winogradskyella tangerina]